MNEPLRRKAADQTSLRGPAWRLPALFLSLLLFSVPSFPSPATEPDDGFDPERIIGVWIRTQRAEDDALRRAAIEEITQSMSFVVRGLARAVMTRSIRPAKRYVIRPAEVGLSIRPDDEAPVTALLYGQLDPDPDARVRSRPLTDGFVQNWWAGGEPRDGNGNADGTHNEDGDGEEDGNHGTTTWRLDTNDGLLRVTVTVHDERFPHPLVYTTTYRRSEETGSDRAGLPPNGR
jgi:hypothetical protein